MPTHEECCWRVCLLCMKKCKEMRPITEENWKIIEEFFVEGLNSEQLPKVICGTCRKVTSEYQRGIFNRKIEIFDFSQMNLPTQLRSGCCNCYVCKVAKSVPQNISMSGNAMAIPARIPVGRPSLNENISIGDGSLSKKPKAIKLCTSCFAILMRGCAHNCSKRMCASNLRDMTDHLGTPTCKEKLSSNILSDIFASSGPSSTISLSRSAGRPLSIKRAESSTPNRHLFTLSDMSTIQTDLNLSNNQTIQLANHMRAATSDRNLIETKLKKSLELRNQRFEDFFSLSVDDFLISENENTGKCIFEKRSFIYCNDVKSFVSAVEMERNKTYNYAKIGIDGGCNTLKVCLTLFNLTDEEESNNGRQSYRFRLNMDEVRCLRLKQALWRANVMCSH